jgi:DNA-binding LacI/PurR family transcriptional regulator
MKRITLRDIAEKAGVSHVTVSLALRNRSEIPKGTRERIKKLAKSMGYVPDPALGRLNVYRRKSSSEITHSTIAWINQWEPSVELYQNPTYSQYWKGAKTRAKELGYRIEEFKPFEDGMTLKRLSGILLGRGITGIMLPPVQHDHSRKLKLPWKDYSVVRIGYSLDYLPFNVVSNAQFETAFDATSELAKRGCRSIGWTFLSSVEDKTVSHFLGGYQAALHKNKIENYIPPLFLQSKSPEDSRDSFLEWYAINRPNAILAQDAFILRWLRESKIKVPDDVELIHLALPIEETTRFTGMHQDSSTIGAHSVNLLDRMIRHDERGIPTNPLEVQIKSHWIDGETSRKKTG